MQYPSKHARVADLLRTRIHDGTYPPYERLPTTLQLAEEFDVHPFVITRAQRLLREDGLTWASLLGVFVVDHVNKPGEGPPAREILDGFGIPQDVVDDVLAIHAHQLAEQQRRYAEDILDSGYASVIEPGQLKTVVVAAVEWVTDLIDPKVNG